MERYDFEGDERWQQYTDIPAGVSEQSVMRLKHRFYKRFVVCVCVCARARPV